MSLTGQKSYDGVRLEHGIDVLPGHYVAMAWDAYERRSKLSAGCLADGIPPAAQILFVSDDDYEAIVAALVPDAPAEANDA